MRLSTRKLNGVFLCLQVEQACFLPVAEGDGLPLIGGVPGVRGAYVAAGEWGNGRGGGGGGGRGFGVWVVSCECLGFVHHPSNPHALVSWLPLIGGVPGVQVAYVAACEFGWAG